MVALQHNPSKNRGSPVARENDSLVFPLIELPTMANLSWS